MRAAKNANTYSGAIHRAHDRNPSPNGPPSTAMNRTNRLVLVFVCCLAVIIGAIAPVACTRQEEKECTLSSEDYAVYSAVLLDHVKRRVPEDNGDLIIYEVTRSSKDYIPPAWEVRAPLKQVSDETVAHFNSREKNHCRLRSQFDQGIPYRIVSTEELEKIFKRGDWPAFSKEYPKSFGFLRLSPVGYNTRGTEALVYVEQNCGGLCGGGVLIVLKKEDGRWIVKDQTILWNS
jgi:hypothetical protein